MRRTVLVSSLCVILAVQIASAVEGRIPIVAPTTIATPGSYIVTRDFNAPGATGILIQANDVTVDLNQRTITAGIGAAIPTIIISIPAGSGVTDVTIRNGRLVGGKIAIQSQSVGANVRIEGVEVRESWDAGIHIEDPLYAEVRGCRMANVVTGSTALEGAIIVTGSDFTGKILDNQIADTDFDGIRTEGMSGGEVMGNVIHRPSMTCSSCGAGIQISTGNGTLVAENTVSDGRGPGITVDSTGTVVRENVVTNNAEGGISIASDGNHVLENIVRGNGDSSDGPWGILVTGSRNLIRGNQVEGNQGHGIHISGAAASHNFIDDNSSTGNAPLGWCGLQLGNPNSHVYRDNHLRNNAGGSICGVIPGNIDAGGNII